MRASTLPMFVAPTGVLPLQSTLDTLALMPEEDVWLASCKSPETRQAYAGDVRLFIQALGITSREELRQVDHKAVIGWEHHMREVQHLHPATIRRRLAALSSLFRHLVKYGIGAINPIREIERPAINWWEGMTPAFTPQQARALLDALNATTIQGLRDRTMLSVGLQVGLRRSEIIRLRVRDLLTTRGCDALRIIRKGGKRDLMAIHPETAQSLRANLEAAGHVDERDGPLFRPMSAGRAPQPIRRQLCPDGVDSVVEKYLTQLGLGHGDSAHSMRATFITTALESGAKLEDIQRTVGHADPSTTQLYDRRRFMPEKSAALVVAY
jgi:integrase/recombinase XerD